MTRQDFRFFHRLRVRWVEVDMQKIVFNGHYLMYFDTAISDYWRALALPYEEAMHQLGGDLYLKKASVEYHRSARFDEQLEVALKCDRVGNSSITFTGAIFRGNELLVEGGLIYVFADPASQTSRPVPEVFRNLLMRFEGGQAVADIKIGDWATLGVDAARLRTEVFVHEQRIPLEQEWDEADHGAIHAVAYNALGQPVATGRLLTSVDGSSKVGRMAVKQVLRGSHLGRDILHALSSIARQRGDSQILLNAQRSAEGFYQRAGFTSLGKPFDEVDIPHIQMFKLF
ncbi:MAG: YbgC/FadM family acyl-CoA thioesterase [Polaromonas sp.]|nr:YbgC/FadM family acyl-CoA thioesterase [Polaromonas sp.]